MKKFIQILAFFTAVILVVTSCSSNFHWIGIINNSDKEVLVITSPIISPNDGTYYKYISYYSKDSIIWKEDFWETNTKILQPNKRIRADGIVPFVEYPEYKNDTVKGVYIMRPYSTLRIGSTYKANSVLDISKLTIETNNDTLTASSKSEVYKLLIDSKLKSKKIFKIPKKALEKFGKIILIKNVS